MVYSTPIKNVTLAAVNTNLTGGSGKNAAIGMVSFNVGVLVIPVIMTLSTVARYAYCT